MNQEPSRLLRAAVSLLLLSSASGCSLIFVRTPPSDGRITARVRSGDCTTSRLAPGFDTTFAALQLLRTGLAATAPDRIYEDPKAPLSREADIALGVGFMALFAGSAIYGFVNTSRCSRMQRGDEHEGESPADPPERWEASTPATRPPPPAPPVTPPVVAESPAASSSPPPPPPAPEPPSEPAPPPSASEIVQ